MGDDVSQDLRDYLLAVARNPLEPPDRSDGARREQRALAEQLMERVVRGEVGPEEIAFTRRVFAAMLSASVAEYPDTKNDRTKRGRAIYRATGLDGHKSNAVDDLANAQHWLRELTNDSTLVDGLLASAFKMVTEQEIPSDDRAHPLVHLVAKLRRDANLPDEENTKRQMRRKRR